MSHGGGYIEGPVSINDIKAVVGGTSLITAIRSGNINKWSKYKPVKYGRGITRDQWDAANNTWKENATWWRGDGHCGLSFTAYSSLNVFLPLLKAGSLDWTYTRPSGGDADPFRIKDFAGYFHYALPPVGELGMGDDATIYIQNVSQGVEAVFSFEVPSAGSENLTLANFSHKGVSLSQFYFGVCLWKGNYTIVVTGTTRIGDAGDATARVVLGYSDRGDWNLIPFLSDRRINRDAMYEEGVYISAGVTKVYHIHLVPSGSIDPHSLYSFLSTGSWRNGNTKVAVSMDVVLKAERSYTFPVDRQNRCFGIFIVRVPHGGSPLDGETVASWYVYGEVTVETYWSPDPISDPYSDDVCALLNVQKLSGYDYYCFARPMGITYTVEESDMEQIEEMPIDDDPIDDEEPLLD